MSDTKKNFLQLGKSLRLKLNRMKYFFIADINDREKMNKKPSEYTAAVDYADKTELVLSGASSRVSLYSFTAAIGTPVGIASICLVFLISNGIVKIFLKAMGREKNKHIKIALSARSKINSIEKIISKALIDSNNSHEVFLLVIN